MFQHTLNHLASSNDFYFSFIDTNSNTISKAKEIFNLLEGYPTGYSSMYLYRNPMEVGMSYMKKPAGYIRKYENEIEAILDHIKTSVQMVPHIPDVNVFWYPSVLNLDVGKFVFEKIGLEFNDIVQEKMKSQLNTHSKRESKSFEGHDYNEAHVPEDLKQTLGYDEDLIAFKLRYSPIHNYEKKMKQIVQYKWENDKDKVVEILDCYRNNKENCKVPFAIKNILESHPILKDVGKPEPIKNHALKATTREFISFGIQRKM